MILLGLGKGGETHSCHDLDISVLRHAETSWPGQGETRLANLVMEADASEETE